MDNTQKNKSATLSIVVNGALCALFLASEFLYQFVKDGIKAWNLGLKVFVGMMMPWIFMGLILFGIGSLIHSICIVRRTKYKSLISVILILVTPTICLWLYSKDSIWYIMFDFLINYMK